MHIKKGYTLTGKESDEKTGYGYFPHQARQTSTGHIPLLCPCQKPTISHHGGIWLGVRRDENNFY